MDIKREREQLHILETLLAKDKNESALSLVENVEKEFPNSFQIKFIKSKILIKLKKNIRAEEILKELEKIHSDNLNLLKVISDFYDGINKKEEFLDYLNKIIFIDPFNAEIKNKIKNVKIQIERQKLAVADTLPEVKIKEFMDENKEAEHKIPKQEIELDKPKTALEQKKPKSISGNEKDPEDEFNTLSAANIYIDQGLYKDALIILENIYKKENDESVLSKIESLKNKIKITKKIEKLTSLMYKLKQDGR